MLWRFGMFFLVALLLGITLRWRPRLLPYPMVEHALIDLQVALMVWQGSAPR